MENRNILYLAGSALPEQDAAAHRVVSNAKALRDLGYNVYMVGLLKAGRIEHNKWEGLEYWNLNYAKRYYLFSVNQFKSIFEQVNPSVIICYNYPAFAMQKLIQYGHKHHVKIVSDVTEWYLWKGSNPKQQFRKLDTFLRMKVFNKKVDGLIAISSFLTDFYKGSVKNVVSIPPLVDLNEPIWNQPREETSEKVKILFAGTIGNGNKDRVDKIISLFGKVQQRIQNEIELTIIGVSKDQVFKKFHLKDTPKSVFFKGRLSHKEVVKELINSDFQLFLREKILPNMAGFPTKFAESVSTKTLVLTNSTSDLPKYLNSEKYGFLLDIDGEENIEERLINILNQPIDKLREKENQIDCHTFDYHNYLGQFKNFLDNLLQ